MAGGTIKEFHYSISKITGSRGYKPRAADQRLGYFVTTFTDLGKYDSDEKEEKFVYRPLNNNPKAGVMATASSKI